MNDVARATSSPRRDPRPYQVAVLTTLLLYGTFALDLDVRLSTALVVLATCQAVQWLASRWVGLPHFDPRSALISSLSLALLLRTPSPMVAAAAAALAIGSKFAIRVGGKHVFNPTNFGIVAVLLLTDRAWVSPGTWGTAAWVAALLAGLGGLVLYRAERGDVTIAFLVAWGALRFGRALWLGDPLAIPLHQIQSGALLIFAFFMISDPKTIPDRRAGRILYAALVAGVAGVIEIGLYRPHGPLWSLFLCAPLVPAIDRVLPAGRYRWRAAPRPAPSTFQRSGASAMRLRPLVLLLATAAMLLSADSARAFCGFYVAKADTALFNQASKVVLARDGDRTVITMANDFRGDPREFAVVIPVPTFLERGQIHVGERADIEHLDAYTAPRLVEYHDPDPCRRPELREKLRSLGATQDMMMPAPAAAGAQAKRVRIEARYAVGEYEILILSADESRGLASWLRGNGYRLPDGAEPVLESYIKQKMRFFVAKVDLDEQARLGFTYLRPLQVAYESPRFMLPIRLGTLNADGDQELFVFTLTRSGRVEPVNYRTVRLPTDVEIPPFVANDFGRFYQDLFRKQVERDRQRVVYLEYAWDMAWCDPCAANPLSPEQLRTLGVFWLGDPSPPFGGRRPVRAAQDVFVTRLHLRYTGETFPEDLRFHETGDRSNFQGRYVMRQPFTGSATCPAGDQYRRDLRERQAKEAETLASLTGWSLADIWARAGLDDRPTTSDEPWWKKIWGG